jgi:hypothetical protein
MAEKLCDLTKNSGGGKWKLIGNGVTSYSGDLSAYEEIFVYMPDQSMNNAGYTFNFPTCWLTSTEIFIREGHCRNISPGSYGTAWLGAKVDRLRGQVQNDGGSSITPYLYIYAK